MNTLYWLNPDTFEARPEEFAFLSPEERAQHQRFIPPLKRHEYLVARLLTRTVLGEKLGVPPESLRFTENPWGRPELASAPHFNLTHTEGLVALFVSDEHEVGADTERLARAPKLLELAPNVFAPAELADLAALPEAARPERAVTLWTLKESYLKARGMGLALALDGFAFRFDGQTVRLEVEPRLNDEGSRWQFQTLTHGEHLISLALSATSPPPIEVREWVP